MDNEEEQQGEEEATQNNDARSEPKADGLIDRANASAERLEVALKKQEELINRQEELAAKRMLAGKAEAGIQAIKEAPISDEEYAKKMMQGEVNPLKEDGFNA